MDARVRTQPRRASARRSRISKIRPRIIFVLCLLLLGLLAITLKLVYLQILDSNEKYAAQLNQLVDEVQLTAERGNIYDRNMNVLVQDSSAKSVNLIPKQVKDPQKVSSFLAENLGMEYDKVYAIATQLEDDRVEITDSIVGKDVDGLLRTLNNDEAYEIDSGSFYVKPKYVKDAKKDAAAIATLFGMSEDKALEYVTAKENTAQRVKGKVDNSQADSILESLTEKDEDGEVQTTNGVELLEDKKRYYTNGNFASYILGFTGQDHEGLYGVEKTFDDQLRGENGIVYYQKDAQGNIIPTQTKTIQDPQKGEDLVLSIDSNIQSAAEKTLETTVSNWHAKSGTAIVMNVKTGEIIAMASKPDYDLNNPYNISETFAATHAADLTGLDEAAKEEQMWRNPSVSFIYEPGSTFKPITVSTALEEGAIDPSMSFECTGSINIAGTTIHCTGIHGTQSIAQTLENSCNPGLVQIIKNVDPNVFYKYVYNYGFGKSTGIELTGEENGIVNRVFDSEGNIKIVDYSTFSFGQGLATTPIQILTALTSLINNGYYVQPTILKSNGSESPRQIVSTSTSQELRKDMRGVLESKTALEDLAKGFEMGGKTGTAEKFVDGNYSSSKYVTSFFCFAPYDDPIYSTIVVLDEPDTGAAGATSAAPAAIDILKQALIYSGSNPNAQAEAPIVVPDCQNQDIKEVESLLQERNIEYVINRQDPDGTIVLSQSIPAQTTYNAGDKLVLVVGKKQAENDNTVPDFTGMTVQKVNEKLQELDMNLDIQGSGFAVEQSIAPGTPAEPGQKITVRFQ